MRLLFGFSSFDFIKKATFYCILLVLNHSAQGGTLYSDNDDVKIQYNNGAFIAIDGGIVKPDQNPTLAVANGSNYPSPHQFDQYTTSNSSSTTFGYRVGYHWSRSKTWLPEVYAGFGYRHIANNDLGGYIYQYSLPQFKNYQYQWEVKNDVLSLFTKLTVKRMGHFLPYISASLGRSWNQAHHFDESPLLNVTPRVNPDFANAHFQTFAYSLGLGVDIPVKSNMLLSCGYEYFNLGSMHSENGSLTWSKERLDYSNYSLNAFLVSLSYFFQTI